VLRSEQGRGRVDQQAASGPPRLVFSWAFCLPAVRLNVFPAAWSCQAEQTVFPSVAGGAARWRAFAAQMPGKGDDLGNGAVQRFGNGLAQFQASEQFDQFGIFVDRYFIFPGNGENRLSQL